MVILEVWVCKVHDNCCHATFLNWFGSVMSLLAALFTTSVMRSRPSSDHCPNVSTTAAQNCMSVPANPLSYFLGLNQECQIFPGMVQTNCGCQIVEYISDCIVSDYNITTTLSLYCMAFFRRDRMCANHATCGNGSNISTQPTQASVTKYNRTSRVLCNYPKTQEV